MTCILRCGLRPPGRGSHFHRCDLPFRNDPNAIRHPIRLGPARQNALRTEAASTAGAATPPVTCDTMPTNFSTSVEPEFET